MINKIPQSTIDRDSVASLNNRPNNVQRYGGDGLTPQEMKNWYDKLPLDAISKINELIDAFGSSTTAGAILSSIFTKYTSAIDTSKKMSLEEFFDSGCGGGYRLAIIDCGTSTTNIFTEEGD